MRATAKQGKVVIARTIRERVEKELGKKVSKDYTYDLLHRHGWRKISPRPRHPKGDPSLQEEFKKNYQPLWVPLPTPSTKRIPDRWNYSSKMKHDLVVWLTPYVAGRPKVLGRLFPCNGDSFSLILPYANTEMMSLFLREFSEQFKEYRIVMDGAAWHKSKRLENFENIRIIYQPPYSPEVNPAEHLWEHLREKYLSNRYWATLDNLESVLSTALAEASKMKKHIQSLVGFHWAII